MARDGATPTHTTMARGQSRPQVSRTAGRSDQPFPFPALLETCPLALWYLTGRGGTAPWRTPCVAGYIKPRYRARHRGTWSSLAAEIHQTLSCITFCSRLLLCFCDSLHSACLWVTTSPSWAPATFFCNSKMNSRLLTCPKSQYAKEREPLCLRFSKSPAAIPGLWDTPSGLGNGTD